MVVSRDGCRWQLDLREGIDLGIYLGVYEPELSRKLKTLAKPGFTVLDIGANIGAQALLLAKDVGAKGRVIAVEPTNFAYRKLLRNFSLNPELEARTIAVQAILVDDVSDGPQEIASSWPLTGDRTHLDAVMMGRPQSIDGARRLRLDQLVEELRLEQLDLIKIDVDGNEVEALGGGLQALERFRPTIAMEFAPHVHTFRPNGFADFLGFVQGLGYEARTLKDKPIELVTENFHFGSSIDLILTPKSK
jgi:FkbM family methyltransferase